MAQALVDSVLRIDVLRRAGRLENIRAELRQTIESDSGPELPDVLDAAIP